MKGLDKKQSEALIKVIDDCPELIGAGIVLLDKDGKEIVVRGGPRASFVFIQEQDVIQEKAIETNPKNKLASGWDRWKGAAFSCGSAVATGVVIFMSGGTATPVVGFFALNSAALCGVSVGKAIAQDEWAEFEKQGGTEYKAWMSIETLMSLADLLNGAKGALGFLRAWKQAGKLAKLQKAVANRKLTRKQLLKAIQEIDPSFQPVLKGPGYISKHKLVGVGHQALEAMKFVSLSHQRRKLLIDAIGNILTLGGTGDAYSGASKTYDILIVQYNESKLKE